MPINFFERMKNVCTEQHLRSKLTLSGEIVNYFKTSKASIEALSKIAANVPVINELAKK